MIQQNKTAYFKQPADNQAETKPKPEWDVCGSCIR